MDEQTSVDLHYGYQTDYRMTVSARSYIASDYIVAGGQYLLLNYYHYNTQKNNYMLSKSMLEELRVDQVFSIVDAAGGPLDYGAAVGKIHCSDRARRGPPGRGRLCFGLQRKAPGIRLSLGREKRRHTFLTFYEIICPKCFQRFGPNNVGVPPDEPRRRGGAGGRPIYLSS